MTTGLGWENQALGSEAYQARATAVVAPSFSSRVLERLESVG